MTGSGKSRACGDNPAEVLKGMEAGDNLALPAQKPAISWQVMEDITGHYLCFWNRPP